MKEKHTVIIDHIGRIILGVETDNSAETLTLKNPIILHFQQSQNGGLELQVFPLFFFELIDKNERDSNHWTFNKESVVISNVTLNPDILARYAQINTPPAPVAKNPKVISIDDIE